MISKIFRSSGKCTFHVWVFSASEYIHGNHPLSLRDHPGLVQGWESVCWGVHGSLLTLPGDPMCFIDTAGGPVFYWQSQRALGDLISLNSFCCYFDFLFSAFYCFRIGNQNNNSLSHFDNKFQPMLRVQSCGCFPKGPDWFPKVLIDPFSKNKLIHTWGPDYW